MNKLKDKLFNLINYLKNPRVLISFLIAWMITNGWAYIILGLGLITRCGVLSAISGAYLAFLWLPFTPEKVVTILLTGLIAKYIFNMTIGES